MCVQCLLFWPSLNSLLEFSFKNSASFCVPVLFAFLFAMVPFSCWVQCDSFSHLQSGKTLLSHMCLPHADASSAVNQVVEQPCLKADLLTRLIFLGGYLSFSLLHSTLRVRKE